MLTTEDRLAALEAKLADLTVADLPMAALQRKLESSWSPDPTVLFKGLALCAAGKTPITWNGTTNVVTGTTSHPLGRIPQAVVVVSAGPMHYLDAMVTTLTAESFSWQVSNVGGTPPAGYLDDLYWIAVG